MITDCAEIHDADVLEAHAAMSFGIRRSDDSDHTVTGRIATSGSVRVLLLQRFRAHRRHPFLSCCTSNAIFRPAPAGLADVFENLVCRPSHFLPWFGFEVAP